MTLGIRRERPSNALGLLANEHPQEAMRPFAEYGFLIIYALVVQGYGFVNP